MTIARRPSKSPTEQERRAATANHCQSSLGDGGAVRRRTGVETLGAAFRVNVPMALVIVGLIVEALFVVFVIYGIYRLIG